MKIIGEGYGRDPHITNFILQSKMYLKCFLKKVSKH